MLESRQARLHKFRASLCCCLSFRLNPSLFALLQDSSAICLRQGPVAPRLVLICRSPAQSMGGLGGVDAVAPCLLLGFALSNGSEPWGAEQGAEQQSMGTGVWVDPHRC